MPHDSTTAHQSGGMTNTTATMNRTFSDSLSHMQYGRISKPYTRSCRARGTHELARPYLCNDGRSPVSRRKPAARDVETPTTLTLATPTANVSRTDTSLHGCSELSIAFVATAGLTTTADTKTITLNLMDHFLFSESKWLPELSHCKLHAACFLIASALTEADNTAEQIVKSLGPDTAFVKEMAALLAVDEEEDLAIRKLLSVDIDAVEDGYRLLYDRKDELAALMGGYACNKDGIPLPRYREDKGRRGSVDVQHEDLDTFVDP